MAGAKIIGLKPFKLSVKTAGGQITGVAVQPTAVFGFSGDFRRGWGSIQPCG